MNIYIETLVTVANWKDSKWMFILSICVLYLKAIYKVKYFQ